MASICLALTASGMQLEKSEGGALFERLGWLLEMASEVWLSRMLMTQALEQHP